MKLRSLLLRQPADRSPLPPVVEPEERPHSNGRAEPIEGTQENTEENPGGTAQESLERLLTPNELDLIRHHRL